MHNLLLSTVLILTVMVSSALQAAPPKIQPLQNSGKSSSSSNIQPFPKIDLEIIRKSAKTFSEAYNKGDADAIAAHFTSDADYFDEDGTQIIGREEIRKDFASIFENSGGRTLQLKVLSIKMISPTVAIEDGKSFMDPAPPGPPVDRRYTVIHVKQNGKWLIKSVRDSRSEKQTNDNPLKELEWMVGDWVDEGEDSLVSTKCRFSRNKRYLLRQYSIQVAGKKSLSGVQRIGWDPLTKRIKSWVFDSEGTLGEGIWNRDGKVWTVSSTFVLPGGTTASSTNVFEYLDEDSYRWSSYNRVVGGMSRDNIENIIIVKKPPAPAIK